MKKTKMIAFTLAAVTMLMGAGYAYWTDTLTINNTVSTGEFNVDMSTVGDPDTYDGKTYPRVATFGDESSYATINITESGKNSISLNIGNMYPGAKVVFETLFKNTGTIPAVFDEVIVTKKSDPGQLYNHHGLFWHASITKWKLDGNGNPVFMESLGVPDRFINGQLNGINKGPIKANFHYLANQLNVAMKDVRLEPGEYISFDLPPRGVDTEYVKILAADLGVTVDELYEKDACIYIALWEDAPDKGQNKENKKLELNLDFKWKQHNAQ